MYIVRTPRNREQVAITIRWEAIIWTAGILNAAAMLPQLIRLFTTKETAGISLEMFYIYGIIQIAFCLEGYFKRNAMLMWCLGLSAVVTTVTIATVYYLRA